MNRRLSIAGSVGLVARGCPSTPAPREELGRARLALEQVEGSGSTQHAALEMRLARENLAAADRERTVPAYDPAWRSAEPAGVDAACIESRGLGETMPMASNDDDVGRQANRRVEIVRITATAQTSQR